MSDSFEHIFVTERCDAFFTSRFYPRTHFGPNQFDAFSHALILSVVSAIYTTNRAEGKHQPIHTAKTHGKPRELTGRKSHVKEIDGKFHIIYHI